MSAAQYKYGQCRKKILITRYIEADACLTAQLITRLRSHVMNRTRTLSLAEEIVRTIRLPQIPARDYRITDFGAQDGGQPTLGQPSWPHWMASSRKS